MNSSSDLKKILKLSSLFHVFLVGLGLFLAWIFKPPPPSVEPVWVELVSLEDLPQPVQVKPAKPAPPQEKPPEEIPPAPEPPPKPEPIVKPEVKPIPQPKPPSVKPAKPKPQPTEKPVTAPKSQSEALPAPDLKPSEKSSSSEEWDMPDFENVQSQQVLARISDNYRSRVVMAMSRFWNPPIGLGLSKNAVAKYEIVILQDGRIQSWRLVESSGSEVLDQRAEQAIKSVTLPPLPSPMGTSWTLIYGFRYENR